MGYAYLHMCACVCMVTLTATYETNSDFRDSVIHSDIASRQFMTTRLTEQLLLCFFPVIHGESTPNTGYFNWWCRLSKHELVICIKIVYPQFSFHGLLSVHSLLSLRFYIWKPGSTFFPSHGSRGPDTELSHLWQLLNIIFSPPVTDPRTDIFLSF